MFGVYFSLRDATQIPFLGPSSPFKATQVVKYGQMQKQMKTPFEELHGLHVNPWQVSLAQMATRMATYIEVTPKTPEKRLQEGRAGEGGHLERPPKRGGGGWSRRHTKSVHWLSRFAWDDLWSGHVWVGFSPVVIAWNIEVQNRTGKQAVFWTRTLPNYLRERMVFTQCELRRADQVCPTFASRKLREVMNAKPAQSSRRSLSTAIWKLQKHGCLFLRNRTAVQ